MGPYPLPTTSCLPSPLPSSRFFFSPRLLQGEDKLNAGGWNGVRGLLEKCGEEPASWALSTESPHGSMISGLGLSKGRRKCRHPSPPHSGLWTTVRWLKLGVPCQPPPTALSLPVPCPCLHRPGDIRVPGAICCSIPLGVCLFLDVFSGFRPSPLQSKLIPSLEF